MFTRSNGGGSGLTDALDVRWLSSSGALQPWTYPAIILNQHEKRYQFQLCVAKETDTYVSSLTIMVVISATLTVVMVKTPVWDNREVSKPYL